MESAATNFLEIGTIAIVSRTFLLITQDVVGLLGTFEFFLCRLVLRVLVRVIFERQFAMRFLDFALGCRAIDTQGLVQVFSHRVSLKWERNRRCQHAKMAKSAVQCEESQILVRTPQDGRAF